MTNHAVFMDTRGTVKGHGLLPSWPHAHSADTAPVAYLNGVAYCRSDDWEVHLDGPRCRVYVVAPTAEPVAL